MVFVEETLRQERYHKSIVFPANHLANVLTHKTKRHRKIHNSIQLNKPKQLNTINQVNPDLVILIRPSVKKRGGPFRRQMHKWTDFLGASAVQCMSKVVISHAIPLGLNASDVTRDSGLQVEGRGKTPSAVISWGHCH